MTARAGDALSHDYFSWPLIQFSKGSFRGQFFQRPSQRNSRHDFAARPRAGTARQRQAQSFRPYLHGRHVSPEQSESGSPPFTWRNATNTNEHLTDQ